MLTARIQAIGGTGDLHPAGLSALSAAHTTCSRITSATERAIVIAGSGRPRVLGPTERQAPISRACPWRLGRSPLENDRESPLSPAHVVPIYLVGLRRSLVSLFGEEEGDYAILETPMPVVVAILNKFEGMQDVVFDLAQGLGAAIDLNAGNAQRVLDVIQRLAGKDVWCAIKALFCIAQGNEQRVLGLAGGGWHIGVLQQLGQID